MICFLIIGIYCYSFVVFCFLTLKRKKGETELRFLSQYLSNIKLALSGADFVMGQEEVGQK